MAYTVTLKLGLQAAADSSGKADYTYVFEVIFDTFVSDPVAVANLPEIPAFFSVHPTDILAVVSAKKPEQDEEDPSHWFVTVEYSRLSRDPAQAVANPLARPPRCSWGTVREERPFIKDLNGILVCNTAGDLYNPPPMTEVLHDQVRVSYNLASVSAAQRALKGLINNAAVTVEGQTFPIGCLRCMDIEVAEPDFQNNTNFRPTVATFQGRRQVLVKNAAVLLPDGSFDLVVNYTAEGWQRIEQNAGYREKVPDTLSTYKLVKIFDDHGLELASPALLGVGGGKLATPVTPGDEVYRVFDEWPKADFSVFNLPAA